MLANYIPTSCVNLCHPHFKWVGISIHRQVESHLKKTRPWDSKIWSCTIFNVQDQIAKLRASIQQADRRKMTASELLIFVVISTLCSSQWAAFTCFIHAKKFVRLSLKTISNVVVKKGNSMNWEEAMYTLKVSPSLKCGRVNDRDCTRQAIMSKKISEKLSWHTFTCGSATLGRNRKRKTIWLRSMRYWNNRNFENQIG